LLTIERQDGRVYQLPYIGIYCLSFVPESPNAQTEIVSMSGTNGHQDRGTRYEGRVINARFMIKAESYTEYDILRNEVFKMLRSDSAFHLIHKNEPNKRWMNCKVVGSFNIPRTNRVIGEFDVQFQSTLAHSVSIGSLLDPLTFSGIWQWGMNIPFNADVRYVHNMRTFSIWNLGDEIIDPLNYHEDIPELQIMYIGASNRLSIRNKRTGEQWQHYGLTASSDSILLQGNRCYKNGISEFLNTNHAALKLLPGENIFELSGTSGEFEISFDFPFLYF
jgi:Phage tail protein